VTLVVMLVFVALILQQSPYWTTDLELCKRGVAVAPNNDLALTNYADELLHRQRLDEAIPIYETVINRNPTYSRASYNIGSCFVRKGDNQTALKYRLRSKEMDVLFGDRTSLAALVCMRLGRMAEATAMFRHAIAEHPEIPAYQYGLGLVLKEAGDWNGSLAAFKAAAAGNPDPLPAQTQIDELEARLNHDGSDASASIKAPLKDH
jgi:tetratricopeptide (TPR) repeat protein